MADADLVTLTLWRSEAIVARHKLSTGTAVAEASYNGKSTKFTVADLDTLAAYIARLDAQIAELNGTPRRTGPVTFTF